MRLFEGLSFETAPEAHTEDNALSWVALIGAYTGARIEAICKLRICDIKCEDGIWCFDILKDKTPSGTRQVPIHSYILKAGFRDYVGACGEGEDYLFPALVADKNGKRSAKIARQFSDYCKRVGLDKNGVGSKYWRRTVSTKLENAGCMKHEIERFLGHSVKGESLGTYSGGLYLKNMRKIAETIDYHNLTINRALK